MSTFEPIDLLKRRLDVARSDSDTSVFHALMYFGEFLLKLTVLTLAGTLRDDRDEHGYRILYGLVRKGSIGDFNSALDDLLGGPAASHIHPDLFDTTRQLTERVTNPAWQYRSVANIEHCLSLINEQDPDAPRKANLRRFFARFAHLRNKTRGHGAPLDSVCSEMASHLEGDLLNIADTLDLFNKPWAYLRQNFSKKYRVTPLSNFAARFDYLKSEKSLNLPDGVYVYLDKPLLAPLVESSPECNDFFVPNGSFTKDSYESLSFITGSKHRSAASGYLKPPTSLLPSQTQGTTELQAHSAAFSTLPPMPSEYIERVDIQTELMDALLDERHPVITLSGRGGIGKTWLAIRQLHQLAQSGPFLSIFWFSARDIDLLSQGPSLVRPHMVNEKEIAKEFARLMTSPEQASKYFEPLSYFQEQLSSQSSGPLLFVLDNFETMTHPMDLYRWLNNAIRLPNKILITTRHRDFKGDYPIDIKGMTTEESMDLITSTAQRLGIADLVDGDFAAQLVKESEGHPYVMKILLGQAARERRPISGRRVIATRGDILDALFERTYADLDVVSRRIFLTLCSWNSTVPVVALEAVLLRTEADRIDVDNSVIILSQMSLVDILHQPDEDTDFVNVPLAARLFGLKKLKTSPMKAKIDADVKLLQDFGSGKTSTIGRGIRHHIDRVIKSAEKRARGNYATLETDLPMLEFLAGKVPPVWLDISHLLERFRRPEDAKEVTRRYIEATSGSANEYDGWARLAELCALTEDVLGEAHAVVGMAESRSVELAKVSNCANRLNGLFKDSSELRNELQAPEKIALTERLVKVMESHIEEANAVDLSKLAWLCLNLKDVELATRYTRMGLERDPSNEHCINLAARLNILPIGFQ